MPKKKLQRFAENESFNNLIQPKLEEVLNKDYKLKGKWKDDFFKNQNELILELGCGKGEYSVEMAQLFPGKNFIGIDNKGARLWYGAKEVHTNQISNCGFIRTKIDMITSFFTEGETDEIWLTFSDPQKEGRRERKRLTSPIFINRYRQLLKKDGIIHLKTDSDDLFNYTMSQIDKEDYKLVYASSDIYKDINDFKDPLKQDILKIRTHYEKLFSEKGATIKYLEFRI